MNIEWPSILTLRQSNSDPSNSESDTMSETTPIPEPPSLPFLGHVTEIDRELPLRSFISLADKYGEIYRLRLPGRSLVVSSSHRIIDELCDEKRFVKIPKSALNEIRNGVHDGLFTARPEEPNWGIAHRVLMPAFGPLSIRGMFDEMHEIATQLSMKWARYGPSNPIDVTEDFTRLALDTLALCSMGYRFNSYYTSELHPFVAAMGDFLVESGNRPNRTMPTWFYRNEDAKYWEDIEVLRKTSDEVLQERKTNPSNRKDLLSAMLNGVDPKTGQHMTDTSITDNLITFLIAGHETTSGLLSFVFFELLKNPEAYRKAQQEVDTVIGKGPITVEHMSKLPYIVAVMRETLRLCSPIPQIGVTPREDTLLAGKYPVKKDEVTVLMVKKMHVDPAVYGEDAEEFKPERMLDEPFNKLPKNAWKPFGNGLRACIGRPFAWQEATLAIAMLLQNFNFVLDDPSYTLAIKQTLTIKPKGFRMRATLRDGMTPGQLEHRLAGTPDSPADALSGLSLNNSLTSGTDGSGKPITILYGSNSGTCEALAQRVASDASRQGYKVSKLDILDTANGNLPKGQPIVIVTASYEGAPPDNAAHFVSWLESIKDKTEFEGVQYTVFGVGHHDWAQTFHRIPKLIDSKLEEGGATRIANLGLTDVGNGDAFADFEAWEDEVLWSSLNKQYGTSEVETDLSPASGLKVSVTSPRTSTLRQDVMEGLVVDTRTLTAEGEPVKKHIEIVLPSDETYRAGDYLAVLPINPKQIVERAMRKFHLPWDAHITIDSDGMTSLPTNASLPAHDIFGAYVELSQPATKRNISTLAEAAKDEAEKEALKNLAKDPEETFNKRISVLDLLEKYTSVDLPLGAFLAMLPPMRVRQYSISSSPLWNPSHVTLTFSVLEAPSKSGQGTYVGVASSYLASLAPGDKLHIAVRPSHAAFHLPQDVENTPVICVGAGTGLAPFRGFVQERASMIAAGRKVAPALLFIGSREPGRDDLYADELAEWESTGAVTVHRAFSRKPEAAGGNRYVQDALRASEEDILKLWREGAKLYICGSRAVGDGVKEAIVELVKKGAQETHGKDVTDEQAARWWEGMRNTRYATDVFD
ncbi:hypothetical protein GL218_00250 [Daldinia childiae]|uniref:uncharacterized protein n=1 Tax=Daldinia childiae TaxID=326645 RepID=UPI001446A07F|nr:uncharacterized protein GL218_00250 [Daldinia childiae]KAF3070556.1 hypothetical protein GL218_00250 [Daldinia childiae]